jgi:hypothetical protein
VLLLASALPAAAQGASELISRTYQREFLPQATAEAVLWQACPPDAGDRCLVLDTERAGFVRLLAPAAVHRRAVQLLAERDTPAVDRAIRVDLVSAETGGKDHLDGVPSSVQRTLEELRPDLGAVAFTHIDGGMVRTRSDGGILLLSDRQLFHTDLQLRNAGDPDGGVLRVANLQIRTATERGAGPAGDDPPIDGTLLHTALDLPVGQTTVAGITRLSHRRNLVVLLTATP